jgi:cell division septum initiation protein DivIVA
MIDNDTGELYGKLLNYCLTYTSTTETEFNYMWTSAQSAMEEYNTANLSTYGLLELLQGKIYEVDNAINAVADSISEYEDKIQAVEDKLNNLSEAAANAKSAATEAIDSTSDYKYKYKYDGLTYYSTKSQKEDAVIDILNQMTKRDTNAKALLKSKGWQGLSSMISSGISKYAKGTKSAKGGITNFDEEGLYSELIPYQVGEGRYTILPQGNPVFSKSMTNELFDFASDPTSYMKSIFDSGYQRDYKAVSNNTSMSSSVNINIAGDATQSTVNALKAQADNIIKRATQNVMNAALRNKNII